VQLCAQVLCVQQMYSEVNTVTGFLFSHKTRTRTEVLIDSKLIDRTLQTILDARKVLTQTRVPEGANDYRCDRCSLLPICLPETMFGEVCEFTE